METSDGSAARSLPGLVGGNGFANRAVRPVRPVTALGDRTDHLNVGVGWWADLCEHLRAKVDTQERSALVRFAGELDLASAPHAHHLLEHLAGRATDVVLDLAWVTFCDASGVRLLTESRAYLWERGTSLTVVNAHRAVRRVLALTGTLSAVGLPEPDGRPPATLPDPDRLAILDTAVREAIRRVRAHAASAQVYDPATRSLRMVAQEGFDRKFVDFFEVVREDTSHAWVRTVTRRAVWIGDVTRAPLLAVSPALDALLDAGSRSLASVPLRDASGALVAVVSAHRTAAGDWSPADRRSLDGLAQAAGRLAAAPRCS